jgi:hypothetical protein
MKCKVILSDHQQANAFEYGVVLTKISKIQISFGKTVECVNNCLEAIRIFEVNK